MRQVFGIDPVSRIFDLDHGKRIFDTCTDRDRPFARNRLRRIRQDIQENLRMFGAARELRGPHLRCNGCQLCARGGSDAWSGSAGCGLSVVGIRERRGCLVTNDESHEAS